MNNPKTIIFKEVVNQVISNKVLRGMAVKQHIDLSTNF